MDQLFKVGRLNETMDLAEIDEVMAVSALVRDAVRIHTVEGDILKRTW